MRGIYIIQNVANGMFYIGGSVDICRRWREHRKTLRNGNHANSYIQKDYDSHGEVMFRFDILEICNSDSSKIYLLEREQFWLDLLRAASIGYNSYPLAGTPKGSVRSSETRKKIADTNRGQKRSPETRARISFIASHRTGRKHSAETRLKMANSARHRRKPLGEIV